jgi:hypothetical protein
MMETTEVTAPDLPAGDYGKLRNSDSGGDPAFPCPFEG